LKLRNGDDIYAYISEMRNVISTFKVLKIDVQLILQYFIWNSMNDDLQSQLTNITNETKPSLEEIKHNIFSATERYLKVKEKYKKYGNIHAEKIYAHGSMGHEGTVATHNFAVNVRNKPIVQCNLCVADGVRNVKHTMRDCTVYVDNHSKVKKLEALNFCSLCSFRNHNKASCRFKFSSPCRNCKGWHFTYLCTVNSGQENSSEPWETVANVVSHIQFNSTVRHDSVLLPTFTVEIPDVKGNISCRILNDTGSQRNFISRHVSDGLELSVVREGVKIVINGLTTPKTMITRVVNVPIVFKGTILQVEAIEVPDIDISINGTHLTQIVSKLTEKGYLLADKHLLSLKSGSDLTDFGMVMGPEATRLFCPSARPFGREPDHSVFLESGLGVMLMGDSESLLNNLDHLENANQHTTTIGGMSSKNSELGKNEYKELSTTINVGNVREVLNEEGNLIESRLEEATNEVLEQFSESFLNYDQSDAVECGELNDSVVHYIISNTERATDGRLEMPLPWKTECKHLLGKNYNLSRKILQSNFRKLNKERKKLELYDAVFQEQEALGIIERIDNIEEFMIDNPDYSFLPHMAIYKMSRDTTKVRVVFLSNLCEGSRDKGTTVSHNNALLPGPCMNSKLSTSVILARFDEFILIFDLSKAFLNIKLKDKDMNKLLFLWYDSVKDGKFKLIAYRNRRLSFGLRPSPTMLMLALYYMLILDVDNDDQKTLELKRMIFQNIYMDNGVVSSNDEKLLNDYYKKLPDIFGAYKFGLQQFATNSVKLQNRIDDSTETPTDPAVKFFGMEWNRMTDQLGPYPIKFDLSANTKRKILATLNSVYDLFNIYGPIVNRAKLYFQRLQTDKNLKWDKILSEELQAEWKLIAKQANSTPAVSIPRCMGSRSSSYTLVGFSDASSAIYGAVLYLVEQGTNKISYLLAKSKVVSTKLTKKSIPTLECQGVSYAVEIMMDVYSELCSDKNVDPVNINKMYLYTDSMVTLAWIRSYFITHDKMQKRSTLVMNRLRQIGDMCQTHPVTFRYIEGKENPSDNITRTVSYNKLIKTSYYSGPAFLQSLSDQPDIEVCVPNPMEIPEEERVTCLSTQATTLSASRNIVTEESNPTRVDHLIAIQDYSSFATVLYLYKCVLKCLFRWKVRTFHGTKYNRNFYVEATNILIRTDQYLYFADVVEFFRKRGVPIKNTPSLILQMNLYIDGNGIIRVKGKSPNIQYPILLHSDSYLAKLIVLDLHTMMSHAGKFIILRHLRKNFWLLRGFSVVKKILGTCVTCKRINGRPIKLNQNEYRSFRSNPPKIPFAFIFMDYIGPIAVKYTHGVQKTWLLLITCLWSRAVSLRVCFSADTNDFLRAVQAHVYEYGIFQKCLSDQGSQLVKGGKLIAKCLDNIETQDFFHRHGIATVSFEQYAKGDSSLGSLVEVCVKQTKHLIIKAIGRNILDYPDFRLLITKTMSIVNRRPIAFKQYLCDSVARDEVPTAITPEMLIYGRELIAMDVIPQLDVYTESDIEYTPDNEQFPINYEKLNKCSQRLVETYHQEFLFELMTQAVSEKDRYKPVRHKCLSPGDIVLLCEPHTKQYNYPMGIVKEVNVNSLGEVTSARVLKGNTREIVFRQVTSLILLLARDQSNPNNSETEPDRSTTEEIQRPIKIKRLAAKEAEHKIRKCL